jgi:hypothetical protein
LESTGYTSKLAKLWWEQREFGNILRTAKAFYGPAVGPHHPEFAENAQVSNVA